MSDDTVIKGTPVSAENAAQFSTLTAFFDPKNSMDRIDGFARWIFASTTVVGVLGVGLVNGVTAKAHGFSLLLFTLAVAFLGLSLTAACWSLVPRPQQVYLDQLQSMRDAVNRQIQRRERTLRWAAVFYALALLLAAAVPVASLLRDDGVQVTYSVDPKGTLTADATLQGLSEGEGVKLDVEQNGRSLAATGLLSAGADSTALHLGPLTLGANSAADLILWRRTKSAGRWIPVQRIALQP